MERQELPEGWVVAPLGELATFEMGQFFRNRVSIC
jgi:hypothetical protein